MKIPFGFAGRFGSFKHAVDGIFTMMKSEHNARVHGLATVAVCMAGIYWRIGRNEWCWVAAAIVAVWVAEALNTAFEFLADATSPDFHPLVGKAKDVAAGAVLITALGSVLIGLLVFGPYAVKMLGW